MRTTALGKNLWRTNNLEQYRGRSSGDAEPEGQEDGEEKSEVKAGSNADTETPKSSTLLGQEPWRRASSYPKVL